MSQWQLLILSILVIPSACFGEIIIDHAKQNCRGMNQQHFGNGTIESTKLIKANGEVSEYCELSGVITPEIRFKLRLPTSWNGKFHYYGGGGFNGYIVSANKSAIRQGYASVASDSGHTSFIPNPLSADFARDNESALELFAYKSVPTVMAVAKQIVSQYYKNHITYSYFEGCSNGGREGLTAALKNPDLFDGMVIMAPARQFIASYPFSQRNARLLDMEGARIGKKKLKLFSKKVLAHCDTVANDGLVDGIIANTEACDFNAETLRCAVDEPDDNCFSDAQLAVVKSYTTSIEAAGGLLRYAGFPFHGREADFGQWDIWLYGTPMRWPIVPSLGKKFLNTGVKNLLAKQDNIDVLTWNFENLEYRHQIGNMVALIDRTNSDLSEYVALGGKIIFWQGSSDVAVSERSTTEYYNQLIATLGSDTVKSFTRYYIAPGVNHCFGGVGATQITQLLPALDKWVVENKPPETLIAHDNKKTFSRPLCVYPAYARYKRNGDSKRAENFECATK